MILLILFAFLAGIVTVLSPCILPLLPIILSSSGSAGKAKPLGVVLGFVASFTFFTLFLSTLVTISGLSADLLRSFSIVILAVFGLTLLVPKVQLQLEILSSKIAGFAPSTQGRTGFWGGVVIGASLGLLWTPCVGPILAAVISLAITGSVTTQAFLITLSYALGTALPMFGIMIVGSTALTRVPWLVRNTALIQKAFGVLMILTALGIYLQIDRKFQSYILETFPNYGVGLTRFEETASVLTNLEIISGETMLNNKQSDNNLAPELILGGVWLNSEPLHLSELRGKVVLVDFWTYSCINCQRTFPYLRAWHEKYQDDGLVIIGVHSPEFEFEKNPENVRQAAADFGLTYPIMQDNDFATWRAYKNRYWPAKYLLDQNGVIRYTHFGEGKYDQTEAVIQELLEEIGSEVSGEKISNEEYRNYARTPELYLGYERLERLASPEDFIANQTTTFSSPEVLPNNSFAYQGDWLLMPEYAAPSKGARLYLNFEAKEVFLVARSRSKVSQIKIELDGATKYFGEDSEAGMVTIDADRLYKLINLPNPGKHQLKIEFLDSDVEIYAFTFG
jgi:cytochrome c biogenesis protein CcdA/thiol-disulfide isomerase/thioredoxin